MINSYYQISLDPTQGTYNDDSYYFNLQDPSKYDALLNTLQGAQHGHEWSSGFANGAKYNPQYRLLIPWVIVDLISCKILLAAAIYSMRLRKRTLAPDIFGYVSSLTRDNPHLNLPDGGSTMSGLERARAIKKVKVRIGDVADGDGVGKVGLRHAEPETESIMEMAHLKKR